MDLFGRGSEDLSTATAASKIGNGVALVVADLSKEPAKGLLRVVDHVQGSVPVLLQTYADVRSAQGLVQSTLDEARDTCDGVASAVGAVATQARQQLRASLAELAKPQ